MNNIVITNERILNFFKSNTSLDPESSFLFFVELLERFGDNIVNNINSTLNKQILEGLNNTNTLLKNIDTNVTKINSDITTSLFIKMIEIKKEYIEDIKNIFSTNTVNTNEKLTTTIEKSNEHLIDKTKLLLNEIIPKNNNAMYSSLNEKIQTFQKNIETETNKIVELIENKEDDDSVKNYIDSIDLKFSQLLQNIQQPIHMYINSSEEKINKNINEIINITKENMGVQTKLYSEMNDFLSKYRISNYKGNFSENQLFNILNEMFPSAEVLNTSKLTASGDIIMKRIGKPIIMFENKDYQEKIYKDEIDKFIRDIENIKTHGIFLSQRSGIANKNNFHIECHKGSILVYIHFVDYSREKIQIAIDIIDNLEPKLRESNTKEFSIDKETLDELYKEFQNIAIQKDNLIGLQKDYTKKITSILDEIKFPYLEKLLSSHYTNNINVNKLSNVLICDCCNVYTCTTIKQMSCHKRGCTKKAIEIKTETKK